MKKCDNNDFCKKMIKIFRKNFIKKKKNGEEIHMKVVFFLQFLIEIFLKKKSIICRVFKGKKKER